MKRDSKLRLIAVIICLVLGACVFASYHFGLLDLATALIIYVSFVVVIILLFVIIGKVEPNEDGKKTKKLNLSKSSNVKVDVIDSNTGVITYDSDYIITDIKGILSNYNDKIGEKLLSFLPETQDIIDGTKDVVIVPLDDKKYEVVKDSNNYVLTFKDISREYDLEQKIKENAYVLGLCNFDNYNEIEESEDTAAIINTNIKLPVIEYFKKFGIVQRTLRNNRLQLILNYQTYKELFKDRFSIVDTVRNESKKAGLNITLSMSFAYGSDDLSELDNEATNLLEIAQNRGGDQIVVRQFGKDVNYYGGTSEAKEKQSTVKVRGMTSTIKKLVQDSSNVIIVGHKDADSDCIGSMLGVALLSKSFDKKPFVVTKEISIEPMMKDVVNKFEEDLSKEFNLVSENEALSYMDENTLVIMCDHHSASQSNCQEILKKSNKVVIIDHHRRKADLDVNAVLIYVEAGASSTCEMVSEFFLYIPNIEVSEMIANIMYLGIVIDTDHFRVRTDTRTFDAVKMLKNYGADAYLVENMSQEPFDNLKKRIKIINSAVNFDDKIIIACVEKDEYSRTTASQACDMMIKTKDVEAAFVICYSSNDETIITARSKGYINVQAVLEKMNGGGHLTAAGVQRKDTNVNDLKNELIRELDKYLATKETK